MRKSIYSVILVHLWLITATFSHGESVLDNRGFLTDKTPIPAEERKRNSYREAISRTGPSVVRVISHRKEYAEQKSRLGKQILSNDSQASSPADESFVRTRGEGSGVIVTPTGFILTNFHQIENTEWVSIVLPREDKEYVARLIGSDRRSDLALLKIDGEDLPCATLGDSDHLDVGDVVIAIGNPFGIGQTSTIGIVSAKGRSELPMAHHVDLANFIQTDASINPGNSGGALIDAYGRLVGINAALLNPDGYASLGIGFAIPINQARSVMEQLIDFGEVRRGFLGISVQKITPSLADYFNLEKSTGALVTNVIADTPAAAAGLHEEDIVTHLNDTEVLSSNDFRSRLSQISPGSSVSLAILRDGQPLSVKVTLEAHSSIARKFIDESASSSLKRTLSINRSLLEGVALSEVDDVWKRQLNLPPQLDCGVVLSRVDAQSPMGRAGIRPGSIILRVNKTDICSTSDLLKINAQEPEHQYLVRYWFRGKYHYKSIYTFR